MEMSCLWTRRLLLGANSVLLVKHPAIAFSTFAATRSIQPPPLISLFSSRRRSLSTTTAACSPPLHPHSDIGNHIESPQSWGLNSFLFFYNHSLCFFFFWVRVGNGAVNAAAAAAIPLESPKMLLKGMSYTELEVCI
jgi:23S rRNA (adenine2503-C2)-methyltransferase